MKRLLLPATAVALFSLACSATGSASPAGAATGTSISQASPVLSTTVSPSETAGPSPTPTVPPTPTPEPDLPVAPASLGQMRQRWSISGPGEGFGLSLVMCQGSQSACPLGSRIGAYTFSPDSSQLAVGLCDGTLNGNQSDLKKPYYSCDGAGYVQLYRVADGTTTERFNTVGFPTSLGFDPTGQRLAVGTADGTIQVLDLASTQSLQLSHPTGHEGVHSIAFTPDGSLLISEGSGKLVFWDVASHAALKTVSAWGTLSFDPTGKRMATAWYDSGASLKILAHVLDLSQPGRFIEISARFVQPHMSNTAIYADFIHDGADILLRGYNGAEWWDAQGTRLEGHTDLTKLFDQQTNAFSPYGPVTPNGLVVTQTGMVDAIPIPGLPAGLLPLAGGGPQTCGFALWDPSTPGVQAAPPGATACQSILAAGDNRRAVLSPDNRYIAADDGAGNLRLWAFDPTAVAVTPMCVGTCNGL